VGEAEGGEGKERGRREEASGFRRGVDFGVASTLKVRERGEGLGEGGKGMGEGKGEGEKRHRGFA
jgi:hypothetical protein